MFWPLLRDFGESEGGNVYKRTLQTGIFPMTARCHGSFNVLDPNQNVLFLIASIPIWSPSTCFTLTEH